jgi:hypothetical protein
MKPEYWGPSIWYLIHSITYAIDDDEYFTKYKHSYFQFYESLRRIIPCPICRNHFINIMKNKDIYECKTKEDIINWGISKHNNVNKRLKKNNITREETNIIYDQIRLDKIIKAIDILTFNTQRNFPINEYKNFFESLRIIFPIQSFRIAYQEGMKINKIKVLNHNSLIKWYLNLGTYILKNLK